jgi:hypothetical protein
MKARDGRPVFAKPFPENGIPTVAAASHVQGQKVSGRRKSAMKRKLGVALLIIATALAGTPEAVKQFHVLNRQLHTWASASLGGSFLVYAETTNERALPDRYDYHEVAPVVTPTDEPDASSYGLMASLATPLPAAIEHTPCPLARRREALQVEVAPRAHATEKRVAAQTARRTHTVTINVRQDQLTREIERATDVAAHALGGKLNAQQFAELIKTQTLETKLKMLRFKQTDATTKVRRVAPVVRTARLEEDEAVPFVNRFEMSAPLPPELASTRRPNEEENRPAASPEEPAKRNANNKTRTRTRPGARSTEQREFDVAPFVIMASTDGETKGFDCNAKDN